MWLAIEPIDVPTWRGPAREFRLLNRPAAVAQPDVGLEPWEQNRHRRRAGRPRKWIAWTLLVLGVNDAPMTPKQVAACWPLIAAEGCHA